MSEPKMYFPSEPFPRKMYNGKSRKKKKNMNTVSKLVRRKHKRAKLN